MVTYYDLVKKQEFRNFVEQRLSTTQQESQYLFPASIPKLYKYRALSEFAVNDIINGHLVANNVSKFNDVFDCTMHYSEKDKIRQIKNDYTWDDEELSKYGLSKEFLIQKELECHKIDSRLRFRTLEYLGTYVSCLSTRYDSILMWAHYAESNIGICIEYNFNKSIPSLLKKIIFPVAYSLNPVQVNDLLDEQNDKFDSFYLPAAVLCSALNKSLEWSYENEWRLILMLPTDEELGRPYQPRFINVNVPTSITFGFHFLKPFFYNYRKEKDIAYERLGKLKKLLSYMKNHNIESFIIIPSIGEYKLKRKPINLETLTNFVETDLNDKRLNDIRFYHVVQDRLMNLVNE